MKNEYNLVMVGVRETSQALGYVRWERILGRVYNATKNQKTFEHRHSWSYEKATEA